MRFFEGFLLKFRIYCLLSLSMVIALLFRLGTIFLHNYINVYHALDGTQIRIFQASDTQCAYRNGTPVHEIRDLNTLMAGMIGASYGAPPENHQQILSQDLVYYTWQNGKYTPAYTIPAGTKIYVGIGGTADSRIYWPQDGYGVCTWPTYDRGWRYGQTFLTEADVMALADEGKTETYWLSRAAEMQPFYYVRLHDLRPVAEALFANAEKDPEYGRMKELGPFWKQRLVEAETLLRKDKLLFSLGLYDSPDYCLPYLDAVNITLLVGAGAGLAACIFLRVRERR